MRRILAPAARELLNWRSLRWKIAALAATACCAVTVAVGTLVHYRSQELSIAEGRDLTVAVSFGQVFLRVPPGPDSVDPSKLPAALIERVRRAPEGDPVVWYDNMPGSPSMWVAQMVNGQLVADKIQLPYDTTRLHALDRTIVMASLAVLAVVVPLSALAAELLNRRLRRAARIAWRIAGGDLDVRTEVDGHAGDEITEISAAVDTMADSLRDRLRREQRFTADVAHELRTPLMGLVTATELLPDDEATDLVRGRVRVLRDLVESLLEISRLDAGVERADRSVVPLDQLIEECLRDSGLEARLTVTGKPVAVTDPRRLCRIIDNLVANAHHHGVAPVEIIVEPTAGGTAIAVRDHGPGFPPELLADGPRRFRTGAAERGQGHGLGLTIALGQAHVIGAELTFGNEGGAVATLHLSDAAHHLGDALHLTDDSAPTR
jgi:signal transduction histidine kinase